MQDSSTIILTVDIAHKFIFKVEINDYKSRADAVYYKIELTADNSKNWSVEKKYKEFEDLHKLLSKKLPNMPNLPTKSIFSFGGDNPDKRKQELESYLNNLSARSDAVSCTEFRNFIEVSIRVLLLNQLENHVKVEKFNKIKKICEIQNLPMAVKDFAYSPSKGIFYALLSEVNVISKIGAFINTFSNPNTKEELSSVIAYKEEEPGSLEFVKLWKSSFEQEGSILCWNEALTILAVGFTTGMIMCLRVSTEQDYSKYDQYCKIHCHTQTVTGICLITDMGHLISIGLDKYLIKTDIAHDDKQVAEKEHPNPLTSLLYDKTNKRIFIGDSVGTTFIYSPDDKLIHLFTINFPFENYVKCLFFDPIRNILLSGSNQGTVGIFEIGRSGKEKLSTLTGTFDTIKNLRALHFYGNKKEVYVANNSGQVALINTLTTQAFYVLDAHNDEVSQMIYLEGKNLMITSSKDKSIKFWRYPFDPNEKINSRSAVVGERKQTNQKVSTESKSSKSNTETKFSSDSEKSSKDTKKSLPIKKPNHDDEEEEEAREPIKFLKYTPAVDPQDRESDEDRDDEEKYETKGLAKGKLNNNKKKDLSDDDEDSIRKKNSDKTNKKTNIKKLDSDDDRSDNSDDEKARKGPESSPKSFLFKNSIEKTITKEEIRSIVKENKETQNVSKPVQKTNQDDPLLGNIKEKAPIVKKPNPEIKKDNIKQTTNATTKESDLKEEKKKSDPVEIKNDIKLEDPKTENLSEMEIKMQEMARKMKEMEEAMKMMQLQKEGVESKKVEETKQLATKSEEDPLETSKAKTKAKKPEPVYEKAIDAKTRDSDSDEEKSSKKQSSKTKAQKKEPDFQLRKDDEEDLSGWNS